MALLFMLTASLGAAVLSLLPLPLLLFGIADSTVWLIGCVALGIFLATTSIWGIRFAQLARFPAAFWTLISIAAGFTLLQVVGAFGLFALPRVAIFAAGLWWLILSAALQFFIQAVAATRS